MMIFSAKVLQQAFRREDIPKLEEEINRLFRSNAFNISQRVQFDEKRKKEFPQLRDPTAKEQPAELIKRMEMRFKVPKVKNRQSYIKAKTEIRPLFNRLTPHGAVNSRSPLVSMIFPSHKDKKNMYNEESKKDTEMAKPQTAGNFASVKRGDLEKIIEQETKKRVGSASHKMNEM